MNGFEYKYNTPNDIFQNILLLQEISPISIGIFFVLLIIIMSHLLYVIPMINIVYVEFIRARKAKKRKDFIRQIAIQKDIEDQIMQEMDEH